jgi:hypothetical protein
VAWQCSQQLRSAHHQKDLTQGRRIAQQVVDTFHTCPIPEIARLGRTLRRWRSAILAYCTTSRADSGGTEAVNGIIERRRRRRRLARGFRNRHDNPLACSSPPAASPHNAHRMSDEPLSVTSCPRRRRVEERQRRGVGVGEGRRSVSPQAYGIPVPVQLE